MPKPFRRNKEFVRLIGLPPNRDYAAKKLSGAPTNALRCGAGLNPAIGLSPIAKLVKVSSVLTISAWTVGLLVSAGCAQHRSTHSSSQLASVQSGTANAPLTTPKNSPNSSALPAKIPSDPSLITNPPPPAQVEVVGAPPGPDYVWIPGHWEWQGTWTWTSGKWATIPAPRAAWIPGHWSRRENGWVWVEGYWRTASLK